MTEQLRPIEQNPFEILHEIVGASLMPVAEADTKTEEGKIQEKIQAARKVQHLVDHSLFRTYGPLLYNDDLTYKDPEFIHILAGTHTLSADIDSSRGKVAVEVTAEYKLQPGLRNFDGHLQWFTAKFMMGEGEDMAYDEITITDESLDRVPDKEPDGAWDERIRRGDKRRSERLPTIEQMKAFTEIFPLIIDAVKNKYPNSQTELFKRHYSRGSYTKE